LRTCVRTRRRSRGRCLRVEDAGDRAEQVAEQRVGAGDGLDQGLDPARGDVQAEQVEVDRLQHEVEDLARARAGVTGNPGPDIAAPEDGRASRPSDLSVKSA
jgi:hypothetical protein